MGTRTLNHQRIVFHRFIRTNRIFNSTMLRPRATPRVTIQTVSRRRSNLVISRRVTPLRIIVNRTVIIRNPNVANRLPASTVSPNTIHRFQIVTVDRNQRIFNIQRFTNSRHTAIMHHTTPLRTPHRRIDNQSTPLNRALRILPLNFRP